MSVKSPWKEMGVNINRVIGSQPHKSKKAAYPVRGRKK